MSRYRGWGQRYAKEHQRPATYEGTYRHAHSHLIPAWGHLPIKDITRTHIRVLLDGVMDAGTSITANRVWATISKLFNWSVERGYIEIAPSTGMRAPAKEISRDRVLTLDEIKAIWQATESMGYPFGYWVQMMFATGGQRSGDVSRMQWPEIRGDWWEISNPTKSTTPHRVPLSKLALNILQQCPRFEDPYVFSTRAGQVPISGYSKAKRLLDSHAHVPDWRFHDIRRTSATLFGELLGKHPYVIERIQNRKSGTIRGVMAVYNRASYEKEISAALSDWAHLLQKTIAAPDARIETCG